MAPVRLLLLLSIISAVFAHRYHRPRYCPRSVKLAVGSYTFQPWLPTGRGRGVTILSLSKNSLRRVSTVSNVTTTGQNPSYCARSACSRGALYCVNEIGEGGALTKFSTTPAHKRRKLKKRFLARTDTGGGSSTHLAVWKKWRGELIVTANFGGSSVSTLYYDPYSRKVRLLDTNVVPKKFATRFGTPEAATGFHPQNEPHPHHILPLSRRYFLAADLGSDRIWLYKIERHGKLKRFDGITLRKGDGPRHMARGKGRNMYVLNELSNTVVRVNGCGKFLGKECERVSVLPGGGHKDQTDMSSAAIRVSADKRFLYASIRPDKQHGRIAAFALGKDGAIGKRVGVYSTHGEHPRDFYIVGNGPGCESYVVVSNMNSNNVVAIKRDRKTGVLHDDHQVHRANVYTPTSVLGL